MKHSKKIRSRKKKLEIILYLQERSKRVGKKIYPWLMCVCNQKVKIMHEQKILDQIRENARFPQKNFFDAFLRPKEEWKFVNLREILFYCKTR